jgi:enoyl-CoA hydratase/carnithine racemase
MRASFEQYQQQYAHFAALTRQDGILEIRLHRGGGACVFDGAMHAQLGDLFADVGSDRDTRIVILTATGDRFLDHHDMDMAVMKDFMPYTAAMHLPLIPESQRLIQNFLDIEVPVIAAVNGPVSVHAEIPVTADVVLAADTVHFSDPFHFINGIVPGDGVQIIWPMLIGPTRAKYFLLTGQQISSREALQLGFVNEVLPAAQLRGRAWTIARQLAVQPDVTLRATRMLFTRSYKRALADDFSLGAALEGLGATHHWPLQLREPDSGAPEK